MLTTKRRIDLPSRRSRRRDLVGVRRDLGCGRYLADAHDKPPDRSDNSPFVTAPRRLSTMIGCMHTAACRCLRQVAGSLRRGLAWRRQPFYRYDRSQDPYNELLDPYDRSLVSVTSCRCLRRSVVWIRGAVVCRRSPVVSPAARGSIQPHETNLDTGRPRPPRSARRFRGDSCRRSRSRQAGDEARAAGSTEIGAWARSPRGTDIGRCSSTTNGKSSTSSLAARIARIAARWQERNSR